MPASDHSDGLLSKSHDQRLEIADHVAVGSRCQIIQSARIDVLTDEAAGAVAEQKLRSTHMIAAPHFAIGVQIDVEITVRATKTHAGVTGRPAVRSPACLTAQGRAGKTGPVVIGQLIIEFAAHDRVCGAIGDISQLDGLWRAESIVACEHPV